MDLKKFSTIFFKSLNPFKYNELLIYKKREVSAYFIYLVFFAIFLGGIFSIPTLGYLPQKIDESLAKFTKFAVTGIDIETNEAIMLLKNPRIVLDFRNEPEPHDAFILITKQDMFIRKFSPSIREFTLYNTTKIPVETYSDVLNDFNMMKQGIWIFLFFMLPSIFFFVFVLNLVKYIVILFLAYVLTLIFRTIARKHYNLETLYKTTIYSSGIMIVSDITLAPFFDLGLVPLGLFLVYFIISQSTRTPKKKEEKDDGFVELSEA